MKDIIQEILKTYPIARDTTRFSGQQPVFALFRELRDQITNIPFINTNPHLKVRFGCGIGGWAAIPWVSILDDRAAQNNQGGTYIVLLFGENGEGCHLKLAQGVTHLKNEHGLTTAIEMLQKQANEIRSMFTDKDYANFDVSGDPQLQGQAARLYEASTILSKFWKVDAIPDDEEIIKDLEILLHCYEKFANSIVLNQVSQVQPNEENQAIYNTSNIIEDGCFMESSELEKIIVKLKTKKNLILQGPPGTGKTWLAKRLGYALIGSRDRSKVRSVQFHPNLSYEDFIRGWRPSADGKLSLIDGPFMEAIEFARNNPGPYVVVVEEINRGNPAQIFGEMLTLLQADKRIADEGLELSYRRFDGERIFIPDNLYLIGTMNIADRSLALVDLALRRRFAFIDLRPNLNSQWEKWLVERCNIPSSLVNEIKMRIDKLNDQITKDQSLGSQFQIGHSYVTPSLKIENPKEWFKQVVETEISPLLNEYWFDNHQIAQSAKDNLIQGI